MEPISPPEGAFERLGAHLRETRLLGSIHSTLYWDQNTVMPAGGAAWRGEQLALLARQLHGRQSSPAYAELVAAAEADLADADREGDGTDPRRRNLQLLRRDLERRQRLDPALVGELALAQAHGYSVWQEARAAADWSAFAPALDRLIALRREQARQLGAGETNADGTPRSLWETLAQPFEPDISKARLEALFTPLRRRLPELLAPLPPQAPAAGPGATPTWELAGEEQERLCRELLVGWGFDPARSVLARSPHPFSCTLGPADFRVTSRVVAGQPLSSFLATAHEWGHSLYEQGLPRQPRQWFAWPLGDATSMGVHESQSLFWECRVARSEAFARRWFPRFRQAAGGDIWGGSSGFWRALNPLRPGLIRVEADELSYTLHIVLRYELELALLEGGLPVEEIPGQWNRRMEQLLGLRPAHDGDGCLQDVHWSEGLFGYFPSYALGHLISAQLAEAMERSIGPIEDRLAANEDPLVLEWLRTHVHPLGRSVNAEELVEQVSGATLSADPFLRHLENKLERLGGGAR